jgi:hypothetical protein
VLILLKALTNEADTSSWENKRLAPRNFLLEGNRLASSSKESWIRFSLYWHSLNVYTFSQQHILFQHSIRIFQCSSLLFLRSGTGSCDIIEYFCQIDAIFHSDPASQFRNHLAIENARSILQRAEIYRRSCFIHVQKKTNDTDFIHQLIEIFHDYGSCTMPSSWKHRARVRLPNLIWRSRSLW